MMKSMLRFGWTGVAFVSMTACYTSPVPIGAVEDASFDTALVGVWQVVDQPEGEPLEPLIVLRFNEKEYYLEMTSPDAAPGKKREETGRMRGFTSRIGNATFMNVQELGSTNRLYTFYRYHFEKDGLLVVRGVKSDSTKFEQAADLRAFLGRNLDAPSIYDDALKLRKLRDRSSD